MYNRRETFIKWLQVINKVADWPLHLRLIIVNKYWIKIHRLILFNIKILINNTSRIVYWLINIIVYWIKFGGKYTGTSLACGKNLFLIKHSLIYFFCFSETKIIHRLYTSMTSALIEDFLQLVPYLINCC